MPAKKTLNLSKGSKKKTVQSTKNADEPSGLVLPAKRKIEIAPETPEETAPVQSVYVQEELNDKSTTFLDSGEKTIMVDGREKLITTFTAGGVVLSFGLSIGSIIIAPVWPAGGGLLATVGIISCFGAFMARESI
ncbi:MAG: hypothetical protein ABIF01_03365 [Candidatus Micrarchaeota archaeon]